MSAHRIGSSSRTVKAPKASAPKHAAKKPGAAVAGPPPADRAKAARVVAAPNVAGFTPLPSLELRDLHPDAKLEKAPIRTWTFANGKATEVPLKPRRAALEPAPKYQAMAERDLSAAVKKAHAARLDELKSGSTRATAMVMPEDGSVRVKAFHLAVLGQDATGFEYPLAMAQVGKAEGFRVVLRVETRRAEALEKEVKKRGLEGVVTLVPLKVNEKFGEDELDFWSEDQGELHVDGSVSVPRTLKAEAGGLGEVEAWRTMFKDRMARLHPRTAFDPKTDEDWAKVREQHPDLGFSAVGAISYRGGQRAIAAVAVGQGKPVTVSNGYAEGGNSLVGRRADGTGYVVIGKDSLAVSRAQLEKDLGRAVSGAELKTLIAADYGVAPEQVIGVEQPHDFHIDMHMMLLPDGHVVLNDAMEAFALEKQWLEQDLEARKPADPGPHASKKAREEYQYALDDWKFDQENLPGDLKRRAQRAREAAAFEARVVKDLEAGGLTVHRMAGVFQGVEAGEPMNFLNGEAAINPDGNGFYVALGGDPRAEAYVVQKLAGELPSGLSNVHFLERSLTGYTLNAMGGLSCRAKLEGALA